MDGWMDRKCDGAVATYFAQGRARSEKEQTEEPWGAGLVIYPTA